MTDHRERETLTITDRCNIIVDGRVLVTGDIDDIFRSEEAQGRYFGHRFDPTSIKEERQRFRMDRKAPAIVPGPHTKSNEVKSQKEIMETAATDWL